MKIQYHTAFVIAAISALVGLPFFSGQAFATDMHRTEALKHAKEAVEQGKGTHADALKQHAEEALKHAKEAKKDPHVDEGIKHLQEAVEHAAKIDVAIRHADDAVTHLAAQD